MRKFSTSGVGFTLANSDLWPEGKRPPAKPIMSTDEARKHLAAIDARVHSTQAALDASLDALMNLFEAMGNEELDETLGLLLLKPKDRTGDRAVEYDDEVRVNMLKAVRDYIKSDPDDFAWRCRKAASEHPGNENVAAADRVASVLHGAIANGTAALDNVAAARDKLHAAAGMLGASEDLDLSELSDGERDTLLQIATTMPKSTLTDPPRRVLLDWGTWFARSVVHLEQGEEQAFFDDSWKRLLKQTLEQNPGATSKSRVQLEEIARRVLLLATSWARNGFPMVNPTHKLAASLMGTWMPPDLVPEVALPWDAFAVSVPAGLVPPYAFPGMKAEEGVAMVPAMCGLFHWPEKRGVHHLCFWAATDGGHYLIRRLDGIADLCDLPNAPPATQLLGRLLLGVIVELSTPVHREVIRVGPPPLKKEGRKGKPPSTWAFELRREVKKDLRPWVKAYVESGGKSPAVQTLVRGHHKRQVHGEKRALRKWIHVEPYWRGPEDAPIVVRSHKLEGRDEQVEGTQGNQER